MGFASKLRRPFVQEMYLIFADDRDFSMCVLLAAGIRHRPRVHLQRQFT